MARITSFIPRQRRRRASIAANAGRRTRRAGVVRRDTGEATTWTKRAAVLGVISASLSLSTAILHWLPTPPSPTAVVVIYAPFQPGGGIGETHPNGTSGRGDHPTHDRDGCARLGKASPWPSPSSGSPTRRAEAAGIPASTRTSCGTRMWYNRVADVRTESGSDEDPCRILNVVRNSCRRPLGPLRW